ncbi:hypothetical protein RQ831_19785 [Roseomonas gilardii]|uniref:Lipoprotein n=1 Tax=Roseomonas gilardii TaxID=257708 RepID=A0A1L7AAU0_9PROT|nr:hypothetical protein [Roseomonas gilardii]APT55853.1 hypothetical protein RGI145_00665 [Roseomonas gilardii]MDT8333297.1 hypothetical protein [Roseomonas gilardii]PZR11708.1 MAG: hypothetical protein DI532_14725 [Azospirillum brasilense]
MHPASWTYPVFIVALLSLAGCGSAGEQNVLDQQKCASYGYQAGSNRFADCMMAQDRQRGRDQRQTMDWLEQQNRDAQARRDALGSGSSGGFIDTTPQFDKGGNPNFDTRGNYIGCHGIGCKVDNPDL